MFSLFCNRNADIVVRPNLTKFSFSVLAIAVSMALAPSTGSAAVIGFLGNFDVINDTGKVAHGFEIDLEGLHSSQITDTFGGLGRGFPSGRGFDPLTSVQRYGAPTVTEYANGSVYGTKVTYMGLYGATGWDYGTPSGTLLPLVTTAGLAVDWVMARPRRATTLASARQAMQIRPLTAGCLRLQRRAY